MPRPRTVSGPTLAPVPSVASLAAKATWRRRRLAMLARTAAAAASAPESAALALPEGTAATHVVATDASTFPPAAPPGTRGSAPTVGVPLYASKGGRGGRGRGGGLRGPPAHAHAHALPSDREGEDEDTLAAFVAALFGWRLRRLARTSRTDRHVQVALEHSVNPSFTVTIDASLDSVPHAAWTSAAAASPAQSFGLPSVTVNGHRQMFWRECALWLSGQFSSGFATFPEMHVVPSSGSAVSTAMTTATPQVAASSGPSEMPVDASHEVSVQPSPAPAQRTTGGRRGRRPKVPRAEGVETASGSGSSGSSVLSPSNSNSSNSNSNEDEGDEGDGAGPSAVAPLTEEPLPPRRRGRPRKVTSTLPPAPAASASLPPRSAPARPSPEAAEPSLPGPGSSGSDEPPLEKAGEPLDHLSLLPRRRRAKRERTPLTPPLMGEGDGGSGSGGGGEGVPVCPEPSPMVELTAAAPLSRPPAQRRPPSAGEGASDSGSAPLAAPALVAATAAVVEEGESSPSATRAHARVPSAPPTPGGLGRKGNATVRTPGLAAPSAAAAVAGHGLQPVDRSQLRLLFVDTAASSGAAFLARTQVEGQHIALDLATLARQHTAPAEASSGGDGSSTAAPALLLALQHAHEDEGALRAEMLYGVRLAVASGRLRGDTLDAGVHALETAERERRLWASRPVAGVDVGETPAFPREPPHAFLPVSGVTLLNAQDRANTAGRAPCAEVKPEVGHLREGEARRSCGATGSEPSYYVLPAGSVMPAAPRIAIDGTYCLRGSLVLASGEAAGRGLPTLVLNPNSDLPEKIYRRFLPRDLRESVEKGEAEASSAPAMDKQRAGLGAPRAGSSDEDGESHGDSDDGEAAARRLTSSASTADGGRPRPLLSEQNIDRLLKRDDEVIARVPMADVEWRYQA